MPEKRLFTGGKDSPLLPELRQAIARASEIEIAVSFVKLSGLRLIFNELADFISSERYKKLTFLCSDYLCITDPLALRMLMLLAERGAEILVHQSDFAEYGSLHLKSYIFVHSVDGELSSADTFIGSSNISKTALTDGLEWNYYIGFPNDADSLAAERVAEIRDGFAALIALSNIQSLSYQWIEQYEARYKPDLHKQLPMAPDPNPVTLEPLPHQRDALQLLDGTRNRGFRKGLVVLATGMGKTYLAAFDALQMKASRVLFVAHREEILLQAETSFQAIMPGKRVGRYTGKEKETEADLIFASIQTIGRKVHLERFAESHFDYIVVDEFHHAAAGSYQRLLGYFQAKFLLGLTATPDRSDKSDILKLCDHNLVYRRDLYDGIKDKQLCPFHYYGIYDSDVDYQNIPWRNGHFDPDRLSTKLSTHARARHALKEWKEKSQLRTLAFCASQKHADFMAKFFNEQGVMAGSVHAESTLTRSKAIEFLDSGEIKVLFSVDLFNEGLDLPKIDTVLMLRPTESKILFLQQLGRGLRLSDLKEKLVVLDFVGNHHSFLNRPELLFGSLLQKVPSRQMLSKLAADGNDLLPDGCFVNFDLKFIEFLDSLVDNKLIDQYSKLKASLIRRPTLKELWQNGASLQRLRQQYGSWWEFLDELAELTDSELAVLQHAAQWFRDLTVAKTKKAFKLVLLQNLLDHNQLHQEVSVQQLGQWSRQWYVENPSWGIELPASHSPASGISDKMWASYWKKYPVKYWSTPNVGSGIEWFARTDLSFRFQGSPLAEEHETFNSMTQEVLDWRLANHEKNRLQQDEGKTSPWAIAEYTQQLKYFPDIKIACGHFKSGSAEAEEMVSAPKGYGQLRADRNFIARASGNSMNGGKTSIADGDYLLLEQISPADTGIISNTIVAIERQDIDGNNQYLLRKILKNSDGDYFLRANNIAYEDMDASADMISFARLRGIIDPLDLFIGREFMREDIPGLFGEEFNPGNWTSGHIFLPEKKTQILLVTLNKQGKQVSHQYHDYFESQVDFHWQSQSSTDPENTKGQRIIHHKENGSKVYLFVRENKLRNKKAAPFKYYGEVDYVSHQGSKPMDVQWKLTNTVPSNE